MDDGSFVEIYDNLDLSRDSELVENSKILKNLSFEKIQSTDKKIKVKIPKNTVVKKISK
jgi:hypothetical protein